MHATRGATRQHRNSGPWRTAPLEDADAISFVNQVQAADGQNLEPSIILAYSQFIAGCKFDGTWDKIKAACILMGARTISGALVPLVGTAPTNFNFVSADYVRKTGLVGDGSTKYLNTNRANNADPRNNHHCAVFMSSAPTTGGSLLGADSAVAGATGVLSAVSRSRNFTAVSYANYSESLASTFIGIARSSSVTYTQIYDNQVNIVTQGSDAPSSTNYLLFARIQSGLPQLFSNPRISFYSIGESLSIELLNSRVRNLTAAIAAAIP